MSTTPHVMQHQEKEVEVDNLNLFLRQQLLENQANEGHNKIFPTSRVKRMMKSAEDSEDSERLSAESPVLMAKACEAFILELTYRAGTNSHEANKNIVKPSDVAKSIMENDFFHFLNEMVEKYVPGYKLEENIVERSANANNLNVGNYVGGNQVTDGNYFGGDPQLNIGNIAQGNIQLNFENFINGNQPNVGNIVEGNQLNFENFVSGNQLNVGNIFEPNQFGTGNFMEENQQRAIGNFMEGNQQQAVENNIMERNLQDIENFLEGNQTTLLDFDAFMGNPLMNMELDPLEITNQQNVGNFVQQNVGNFGQPNQASLPNVSADLMGNPVMGMDIDPMCLHPFMMQQQPPFTPSDQMPFNYPNNYPK